MLLAQLEEATTTPPEEAPAPPPEEAPAPPPEAPVQLFLAGMPQIDGKEANIICSFTNPQTIGVGGSLVIPNSVNANFQFASSSCFYSYNSASSSIYEKIENPASSTQSFYLEKTLTYGDLLIVIFIVVFFYMTIGKSIFNFFFKRWV